MVGYAITLALIIGLYPLGIWSIGKIKRQRLFTVLFPIAVLLLYGVCVLKIGLDVGVHDWNFHNTLPTANISPFTYCLTAVIVLFPQNTRKYLYALVAMLSLGLLSAGMINCVFNIARSSKFYWDIGLDSLLHAAVSFFGIYLVRTEQAKLDGKTCIVGGIIIYGVAVCMMILNVIFHTAFFGLSVYGEHNIYNVVICKSGYLSALVYFLGLGVVLALGTLFQKGINVVMRRKKYGC